MVTASLIATSVLSLLGIAGAGAAYYYYEQNREAREQDFEAYLDELEEGEPVDFKPANVSAGLLGIIAEWRHVAKSKRMAKKGYVKWYKLDSTLSRPTWVKPKQSGSGVPKARSNGKPYYFPKKAMVADSTTGAWVALHREGEADPINLRDPAYPGLEADVVDRVINLEAEDKPPGMLDNLFGGMSQQMLLYGSIAIMFLLYAAYRYSAGGM